MLGFSVISATSFSQTNSFPASGNVGIGTGASSPNGAKLTVNGSARIDSMLVVKDSVRINKNLRVDQDVRFLGETKMNNVKVTDEFVVNGLSKLNGDIKFPNVPLANNYNELNFLLMNQNGMLKKGSGDEFVNALKILMYSAPNPITPINICLDNPYTPTWGNGINKLFVECPDVNVGVGTSTPSHQLTVTKTSKFGEHMWLEKSVSIGANVTSGSKIYVKNSNSNAAIHINNVGNTINYQKLLFLEYDHTNTEIIKVQNTALNYPAFLLNANGEMRIHNGTMETFRIESNGMIRARKVKVDSETWPDYVFEKDYQLLPLNELEMFLLKNKHLPSVPSEKQIKEEGIDVSEMNVKMMEKIEELTLYLIQQNKVLEKQSKELEVLKAEIERLKN
ncbi:hypothetical protein [Fluviicola taffensis]|uniref:Uncharacterized protein n=1 Tax=Fluviicola taffensis (strain DSM 16823 / NCIMB 13979 / RW262) TaxID=755732 RepID=F2IB39_FLUTR|nr:hypothetical protein [Fluviicola taffensis]AEA42122.1 hypothetical protein Fluta_0112 [Fluviicola taffensis DSM 16823]